MYCGSLIYCLISNVLLLFIKFKPYHLPRHFIGFFQYHLYRFIIKENPLFFFCILPLTIEMLLELDGFIFILALVIFLCSFPKRCLVHGTNVIIAVALSLIALNVVAIGAWISITCLDNGSSYKRLLCWLPSPWWSPKGKWYNQPLCQSQEYTIRFVNLGVVKQSQLLEVGLKISDSTMKISKEAQMKLWGMETKILAKSRNLT